MKTAYFFVCSMSFFLVLGSFAHGALRVGSPSELGDFPGAPAGSVYNPSTDGALLGGCGPGAKEFLKKKSSNPASIEGLTPAFSCALQKLIQSSPGVTIGVGTYKTTASSAKGADCTRVQCREGANANGGTHEKGCAADLLYNGNKGPIGNAGPPWCASNQLCSSVHQKAPGMGLQFRLMPGHPGFPGTAEVWHIELKGARAGFCPDSASGSTEGGSRGLPDTGQSPPTTGAGQKPGPTPEDLEHKQIDQDPTILKGSNTLAGLERSVFEEPDVAKTDVSPDVTLAKDVTPLDMIAKDSFADKAPDENPVNALLSSPSQPVSLAGESRGGFFQDVYGGLKSFFSGFSDSASAPSQWQSFQQQTAARSGPTFLQRVFGPVF